MRNASKLSSAPKPTEKSIFEEKLVSFGGSSRPRNSLKLFVAVPFIVAFVIIAIAVSQATLQTTTKGLFGTRSSDTRRRSSSSLIIADDERRPGRISTRIDDFVPLHAPAIGGPVKKKDADADSSLWYNTQIVDGRYPRFLISYAERYATVVRAFREAVKPLGFVIGRQGERFDMLFATRGACRKGPFMPPYRNVHQDVTVGCFSGVTPIAAKTALPRTLKAAFGEEDVSDVLPKSFAIPEQKQKFLDYAKKHPSQDWILKTNKHRGEGIHIASAESVLAGEAPVDKYGLAQVYLRNPLLFDGYKFGIRLWVVIRSVDPLRVYVHKDGLALFTTVKYTTEGGALSERTAQLTNNAVNKNNKVNEQRVWNMATLAEKMEEQQLNYTRFWEFVQDSVAKTFLATEDGLRFTQSKLLSGTGPRHYNDNFFELFGFDFIIDSTGHPWLLEINFTPALTISNTVQKEAKVGMLTDMIQLVWRGRGTVTYAQKKDVVAEEWKDRTKPLNASNSEKLRELFHEEVIGLLESDRFCRDIDGRDDTKTLFKKNEPFCIQCVSLSDVENIERYVAEQSRRGGFQPVLPSSSRAAVLWAKLKTRPRSDMLLSAWLSSASPEDFLERVLCTTKAKVSF